MKKLTKTYVNSIKCWRISQNLNPIIPESFQMVHDRMNEIATDFGWNRPINFQLGAQSLPFRSVAKNNPSKNTKNKNKQKRNPLKIHSLLIHWVKVWHLRRIFTVRLWFMIIVYFCAWPPRRDYCAHGRCANGSTHKSLSPLFSGK